MNVPSEISAIHVVPEEIKTSISRDVLQLEIPAEIRGVITVHYITAPDTVTCRQTGTDIPFTYKDGFLTVHSGDSEAAPHFRPIDIQWQQNRWRDDVQRFVDEDMNAAPLEGGALFTGSSTARMWNVTESFPEMPVLNRGFGGSQYWDLFLFADLIIGQHKPAFIVLYSGDNDVNAGKTPEWVFAECLASVERFRRLAPESHLIILAIKGSGSRWGQYPAMQQVNSLMENYADTVDKVSYLDLGALLLDDNGRPDPVCYLTDALHLSEEGYRRWTDALRAYIHKL